MFKKEDYMKEVENGYVARRFHEDNEEIVILNYTDQTVYDKHWNEITMNCRGLILNEKTGEILARPFGKFFNYTENLDYEKDIPFEEAPEFTIKQDGSLGICYRLNGEIHWSTRGSFVSEQAKIANKIWREKYRNVIIPNEITLLVEIIAPETKVVVDYGEMSDLVIIGAINRFSGYDFSYQELLELGDNLGMKITKQEILTLERALELQKTIDHNNEGWVLRWKNGKRLKIKGVNYMDVHRIMYGLSDKKKVEHWKENKIGELISKVPEEFREEIEVFKSKFDRVFKEIKNNVDDYTAIVLKDFSDKKEMALYINENVPVEYRGFVFGKINNKKETENKIKEFIYRNYSNYL